MNALPRLADRPEPPRQVRSPRRWSRVATTAAAVFRAAGFDRERPLVWIVVEPTSRPTRSRLRRIASLSLQVKGLTVGQFPNASLATAFIAGVLAAHTQAAPQTAAHVIAVLATIIWAWAELAHGVNWFRHCLGLYTLVRLVVGPI